MPEDSSGVDEKAIESGYEEQAKTMFKILVSCLATGDPKDCKEKFQNGLKLAKKARKLAKEAAEEAEKSNK
jgi:hypothetical protein